MNTLYEEARNIPVADEADVIVIGGGLAGVSAAVAAARNGASVILIEKSIILGAKIRLETGDKEAIAARMRELSEKRIASQPLDKPSAGSTFKRPATGYAAAMIDQSGLKGFTVGGAQVSEKHAGFVINADKATFADVTELMARVQEKVHENFGVILEPEVKII